MRVCRRGLGSVAGLTFLLAVALLSAVPALDRVRTRRKVRGTVTDQSGAVVVNATVSITNVGTDIAQSTHRRAWPVFFTGLRPAIYTLKVQMTGFRAFEKTMSCCKSTSRPRLILSCIPPASVRRWRSPPLSLCSTPSATLGTDISSEYVHELPLMNRSFFGLTFLAAGVTEVSGGRAHRITIPREQTSPRMGNATQPRRIRLDQALISAPEQGGEEIRTFITNPAGRGHAGNESAEQ